MAFASVKKYTVTFFEPTTIGATQLKPGDYNFEVQNDKIVITQHGKQATEAPVKVETGDTKYSATSVRYATDNGQNKLQEINVGGTNMKLLFSN